MAGRRVMALIAFVLFTGSLNPIHAAVSSKTPMETIKDPINKIMAILNDPAYQDRSKKSAQREQIWNTARPLFDFEMISKRTVGDNWERFSEEEKKRFTEVFSNFLGEIYIDRIQGEFQNEKVIYVSELVRGEQALARTKVVREKLEIPIDYRMRLVDGEWKIYDVLIENGISLVKNYRDQFQSILRDHPPAYLIERLEKKQVENKPL